MEGNLLKVYALSDQMFWSERHEQKKKSRKAKGNCNNCFSLKQVLHGYNRVGSWGTERSKQQLSPRSIVLITLSYSRSSLPRNETRRFTAPFTRARHWSIPWARWIHSTTPHPVSLRSICRRSRRSSVSKEQCLSTCRVLRNKETGILIVVRISSGIALLCSLFNSGYTASNQRMICEWGIGKDVEGRGRGSI
jgi:hypothetical protein